MKIISWNILTPDLFTESKYNQYYDMKKITPQFRLKKTNKILSKFAKSTDILMLQEVNDNWFYSSIQNTLVENNHNCIYENSTHHGIVVSWNSQYTFVAKKHVRVDQYIINKKYKLKERDEACKKVKDILIVILYDKTIKKNIFLVNYHFPCSFKYPIAMLTHSIAILDIIKETLTEYSENLETVYLILCSDMNSSPDTDIVRYFQENKLETFEYGKYKHTTNNQKNDTPDRKIPFVEILDYIFVSQKFQKKQFKVLLYDEKIISPNMKNPSDHNPIYCEIGY